jgi:GYF domain 2
MSDRHAKGGAMLGCVIAALFMAGAGELRAQSAPPPLPRQGAPPLPQPTPAQFYYGDNGRPVGPFTQDEIRQKIAAGVVTLDTLIWKAGSAGWVALKDVPELRRSQVSAEPCSGKRVLMADDFAVVPSGFQGESTSSENGRFKAKPQASYRQMFTYGRKFSGDLDICVVLQIPSRFVSSDDTWAGLIFGASDSKNFYAFVINASGQACLFQVKSGKLSPAIDWRDMDEVKSDPSAKNLIRVVVQGQVATLYVNGVKFDEINGLPAAPATSQVGMIVQSEPSQRDAWKFANLKVTDLP